MRNLIGAEAFKLKKSLGFKLLLCVNIVSTLIYPILFAVGAKATGYQIMLNASVDVLHHGFIGYLYAAVFLCREFSNRTFAASLLCGHPRWKIFLAKAAVFLSGLLLLFGVYVGLSTMYGSIANGFGMEVSLKTVWNVFVQAVCGLAGCAVMGAVMLLVAAIARRAIVTLGLGIGLTYGFLWLETNFRNHPLPFMKYIYTYQIGQIGYAGEDFGLGLFWGVMIITFLAALAAAAFLFEKAELK